MPNERAEHHVVNSQELFNTLLLSRAIENELKLNSRCTLPTGTAKNESKVNAQIETLRHKLSLHNSSQLKFLFSDPHVPTACCLCVIVNEPFSIFSRCDGSDALSSCRFACTYVMCSPHIWSSQNYDRILEIYESRGIE